MSDLNASNGVNAIAELHSNTQEYMANKGTANSRNGTNSPESFVRPEPLNIYRENEHAPLMKELVQEQLAVVAADPQKAGCVAVTTAFSPVSPDLVKNAPISFVNSFAYIDDKGQVSPIAVPTETNHSLANGFDAAPPEKTAVDLMTKEGLRFAAVISQLDAASCKMVKDIASQLAGAGASGVSESQDTHAPNAPQGAGKSSQAHR